MHELTLLRVRVYEILEVLFNETVNSIKEFLDHKEAITHMFGIPKYVQAHYRGNA